MSGCRICGGTDRNAIESMILAGVGMRGIAQTFGISKSTVHRHVHACMKTQKASEPTNGVPSEYLGRLHALYQRVQKLLDCAECKGDTKTAASLLGQLDDIGRRLQPAPVRGRPESVRIRVVFDHPEGKSSEGHTSMEMLEYTQFAVNHLGWKIVLGWVLTAMAESNDATADVKAAAEQFLDAINVARDREGKDA